MANKRGHRSFGNVRKLPSGRWQARYPGPDAQMRNAPRTFESKREAEQWLSITESQLLGGDWTDPARGKVKLVDYATKWINERAGLRPRTVELYRWLLKKHIAPSLGGVPLGKLTTAVIREWRAALLEAGVSESITAKSYRLLRAVLTTAVDEDKILPRNPCRVRGADKENPAERPTLTVAQVYDLAGRMPERFRVLILLTAFASLRWGEVTALRRCDVGDDGSWVKISFAHTEVAGRGIVVGPPKSRAGVRTLRVPSAIRGDLVTHLGKFTGQGLTALVFTGDKGAVLRRGNFNQRVKWTELVKDMGLPGLHFHDLRHAGNIWAAQTRVSTKDLMARMGHDDMRAALLYQRATSEAAERIADGIDELVTEQRSKAGKSKKAKKRKSKKGRDGHRGDDDEGSAGVLVPVG